MKLIAYVLGLLVLGLTVGYLYVSQPVPTIANAVNPDGVHNLHLIDEDTLAPVSGQWPVAGPARYCRRLLAETILLQLGFIYREIRPQVLRSLEQVNTQQIETEVCIIGGGPAGITLAMRLAESGRQVVLLEGGGLSPPSPEALDLHRGSGSGYDYPITASRLRYLGGTSNHWGGWSRPLDEEDFIAKAHIPYSGWPLTRSDLDSYYPIAHTILQIENARFLLNTEDSEAAALGNQSDWLGRCFMDHTGWRPGVLIARPNLRYSRFLQGDHPVMPVLGLGKDKLEDDPVNGGGLRRAAASHDC